MTDLSSLINLVPMDQVAKALGVDENIARIAVQAAVPTILAGLERNAADDAGAGDLAEAVSSKDPGLLDGLSLDSIDVSDGEKILGHVFGSQTDQVADALGEQLGGNLGGEAEQPNIGSVLAKKLLPLLAPIILAYLAQQATQKGGQINRSNGGLLQEILGGLLTGAGQGASRQGTGGVVGDILTQILRGGR